MPEINLIVEKLNTLLLTDSTRAKKGRIFELFAEIIYLQKKGVSLARIEDCLNEVCFANDKLKKGCLKTYLYQIRKDKEKASGFGGVAESKKEKNKTPAESSQKDTGDVITKQELWEKQARARIDATPRRTNE